MVWLEKEGGERFCSLPSSHFPPVTRGQFPLNSSRWVRGGWGCRWGSGGIGGHRERWDGLVGWGGMGMAAWGWGMGNGDMMQCAGGGVR